MTREPNRYAHAVTGRSAATTMCGVLRGNHDASPIIGTRYVDVTCPRCIKILQQEYPAVAGTMTVPATDHDKGRSPANFPHDCEACVYLGAVDGKDLYFCAGSKVPTVIARYGESPEDYDSGLAFVTTEPHLAVALVLALKRGLIQFGEVLRRL